MLGLGNYLSHSSPKSIELLGSFTSDFTSDVNGWEAYHVEDSASDLTLSANANPYTDYGATTGNGSAPNSAGWLKGVYGVTQTDLSGITLEVDESPVNIAHNKGDLWIWSVDVFIPVISSNSVWSNFLSTVQTGFKIPNISESTGITPGTMYSYSQSGLASTAGSDALQVAWSSNQKPQDGAVFYIKNLSLEIWR
jgi:hypothetical protein